MRRKILVTDGLHPDGMALLEQHDLEPVLRKGLDRDAFLAELGAGGYVAIVLRSATRHLRPGAVDDDVRAALKGVRAVVRQGVGVDNVDIPELSKLGVIVQNTAGSNTESVAQLVFSSVHHHFDKVARYHHETAAGRWAKGAWKRRELSGASIAIVGLGHIGLRVAEIARGWGMRVRGYDLREDARRDAHDRLDVEILDRLEDAFDSDVVTVHVPGTDKTRGLITGEMIERLPAGALFVNTSRAFIADEQMLFDAARSRAEGDRPLYLALDVFAEERAVDSVRIPEDLLEYACLTPHMGASTPEAQRRGSVMAARQIVDLLERGVVVNALNCPRLEEDSIPYVELGDRIATLASGFFNDSPDKIELTLYGEAARFEEEVLLGIKAGALNTDRRPLLERIPAADFLFYRGGIVTELREADRSKETHPAYERAVTVDLVAEKGLRERVSVRGRINYLRRPEIQRIDIYAGDDDPLSPFRSYPVEFPLEGELVVFEIAEDVKTALGAACTWLGVRKDRDIWRTGQSVCRAGADASPTALFVLRLDRALTDDDLAEVRGGAIRVPQADGGPVPLRVANAFSCSLQPC